MTTVIWHFVDGKPGHENQSTGLIAALAARRQVATHRIELSTCNRMAAVLDWMLGRRRHGGALPDPDLIIGAGHSTHLHMLAARRARGGKAVVLMQPSLPLKWFDLCLIPEHDAPPARANVVPTRGVLNRVQPSDALEPDRGLILVGGPSAHYDWSESQLVEHIEVLRAVQDQHWTVATSRRTPASTVARLQALTGDRLLLVTPVSVDATWLPAELARSASVWVTEDSVSMVYEALTAGAATGVLPVQARGPSRVRQGLEQLVTAGWVTTYSEWQRHHKLVPPPARLHEAGRAADLISERWL